MKNKIYIFWVLLVLVAGLYANTGNLSVTIHEDSVTIWHTNLFTNCAAIIKMEVQINDYEILITEKDIEELRADCMCYFNLSVTLSSLKAGNYLAIVKSDTANEYRFLDTVYFKISTEKILSGATKNQQDNSPILVGQYQSDCFDIITSGNEPSRALPDTYKLLSAYPNPFNPETTIRYCLPEPGIVTLDIFNITGQKIESLIHGYKNHGEYKINWSANGLSSGIYFCKLQISSVTGQRLDFSKTIKLIFQK